MTQNRNIQAFLDEQIALYRFLQNFLFIKPPDTNIYLVGGLIRDLICGLQHPKDIDLMLDCCDEATVIKLLKTLRRQENIQYWQKVGRSFPVFKLKIPDLPTEIDFALARTEMNTGCGHRDFICQSDKIPAADDAKRRDFTINALFCRIFQQENCIQHEIIDFFGGLADLEQKVLRCVGNTADRFYEDPLRMLRAIRFARKGFSLQNSICDYILEYAGTLLPSLSKERIHEEFLRAMQQDLRATHLDYCRFNLYPICYPHIMELFPLDAADLPDTNAHIEPDLIFAILITPYLIKNQLTIKSNFFRELDKTMVEQRIPNPLKNRTALSTLYRLISLTTSSTPKAELEKIILSPQGKDGLYLHTLYAQKYQLPPLADISSAPKKLGGQFFINLGFRPEEGFEKVMLQAREWQWQGYSTAEIKEKLLRQQAGQYD